LASLLILTLIFAAFRIGLAMQHLYLAADAEMLWLLYAQVFVSCWVYLDRKGRSLSLPFEFEAFVFFAWPLFLPYYLYKSRGIRRGIAVTVATFFVLFVVPGIAAVIIRVM
jgi:hypothetical protein